jgi:hypothetical protein
MRLANAFCRFLELARTVAAEPAAARAHAERT